MADRKFTPPTKFPAEYVDGNGNKAVILGRGLNNELPYIGYNANGDACSWTKFGQFYTKNPSQYDIHDITTMSDDLLKRLDSLHKQATVERSHFYVGSCAKDAMHRIDDLEAKLAKAVKALGRISSGEFSGQVLTSMPPQDAAAYFARITLAELKGQDDE